MKKNSILYNEVLSFIYNKTKTPVDLDQNYPDSIFYASDSDGRSLLHHAVIHDALEFVKILLSRNSDVNSVDKNGWTPLHYAVQNNSIKMAEILVDSGSDIDATDNNGNTVLWRATFASRGYGEVIDFLINNGANPDTKNNNGISALELANRIGNYDVKKYFK